MYDPIWVCKDGRQMHVGQMTDSHLNNALAKIIRDNWRLQWRERLELELTIRALKRAGQA